MGSRVQDIAFLIAAVVAFIAFGLLILLGRAPSTPPPTTPAPTPARPPTPAPSASR